MKKIIIAFGFLFLGASLVSAQSSDGPEGPPDGYDAVDAYSIFYDAYRADDYEKAIRFGRWIWKDMPETLEGYGGFELVKNLDRLSDIYADYAEELEDEEQKQAYLDTAEVIYEQVFENFDDIDEYKWHFQRGRFYQSNSSAIEDGMEKAVEDYMAAYELNPEKLVGQADGYYVRIILREMVNKEQKDEALALMEEATPYASDELKNNFNDMRDDLFDTPEERIDFLTDQLEDDPENEELLTELRDIYEDEDMTEEARDINERLYEVNPNYENTKALAEIYVDNSDYEDAIDYLEEAIEKADSDNDKADLAMELSGVHLNMNNHEEARDAARNAMDYRPDWGDAYMQMASIYADAIDECASGDLGRRDRAVYWLVIDYLQEAKSVDSSVANRADDQIESYSSAAPRSEDIHFTDEWSEGEEITVDGSLGDCYSWIKESTEVRRF